MSKSSNWGVSRLQALFVSWWVWIVGFVFFQTLASLAIVGYYSPFVPDYDGLSYYEFARNLARNLFELKESGFFLNLIGREVGGLWPITNGLTVYVVAIFGGIFDKLLIPSVVHSVYFLLFAGYVYRVRGGLYAFILVALLLSNTFIFRLQTTLTSELAVGLWLIALLLTIRTFPERTGIALFSVIFVGLAFRAVDAVFVIGASVAGLLGSYVLERNLDSPSRLLKVAALSLALCAAVFWGAIDIAYDYMKAVSFGFTASAWKSLGGVSGPIDLLRRYAEFLYLYSPVLCGVVLLSAIYGFFLKSKYREYFFTILLVGSVCAPLMAAQSLNVQVVFWVYCALVYFVLEIFYTSSLFKRVASGDSSSWLLALVVGLLLNYVFFGAKSWAREAQHLAHLAEVSKVSARFSDVISKGQDIKSVASNYYGVGPLDLYGLRYQLKKEIQYGGVTDVYTKNLAPKHFLEFSDSLNLYIAASKGDQFPRHFGINDVVEETYGLMANIGPRLGFRSLGDVTEAGKTFQLWYRPGVSLFLEFESFGDFWISKNLPLQIGTPELCENQRISGELNFFLEFPQVVEDVEFAPPFVVVLKDAKENSISRQVVNEWGKSSVSLAVDRISCGNYRLEFLKTFSTKQDARLLGALYVRHAQNLKFIN